MLTPVYPQWLSLCVDHFRVCLFQCYNQSCFSILHLLTVAHGVPCQFSLPLSSIHLYLLAYLCISICLSLYISIPALRVNKRQQDSREGKSPLPLTYCPSAVASTPEPAHIPSFPRPPEESFIGFPSLLGKDLGEKAMPNSGGFQRRWPSCRIFHWLMLSNALVLRSMGLPRWFRDGKIVAVTSKTLQ